MKFLGFLSLSVFLRTSFPVPIYYFMTDGGQRQEDTAPNFKAEDKITKVVIDLGGYVYVEKVYSKVVGEWISMDC